MTSTADEFVISSQNIDIYAWVVYGITVQILNIFGISTNIINVICFAKQGFQDTINISLLEKGKPLEDNDAQLEITLPNNAEINATFCKGYALYYLSLSTGETRNIYGLTFSDLGSLTTRVWTCVSLTPAVITADLPFDPVEVMYATTAIAYFSFNRVTSCITGIITLERCLCITIPLKIKSLITPKRATVIIVCVFIFFFSTSTPMYVVNRLGVKFSPARNKTLYGLIPWGNREHVEMVSLTINNFFIPVAAFMIIVVCTTVLSVKLQNSTNWRKKTTTGTHVDRISGRNKRASRMVVMISILFIVCFVPVTIIMFAMAFTPALSLNGKYMNMTIIIAGLGYLLEGFNSSMNIFIYYHMSSVYRDSITKFFCQSTEKKKQDDKSQYVMY